MKDYTLKGFQRDTWLNGIGDLFIKQGGSSWGINLSTYPPKEQGKSATSLSFAPILARKKILNPTKENYIQRQSLDIKIDSTANWSVGYFKDCKALERKIFQESDQSCFTFHTEDGTKVFLPQFELARVLFFHNAYLSRSSLVHDVLNNEYAIQEVDENSVIIHVLESCTCPIDLFKNEVFRRHLTWILTDHNIRQSYESIAQYQLEFGRSFGQYRLWTFQFQPPALTDVQLTLKGNFDSDSGHFIAYEITHIMNLPISVPDDIEYQSPKFKTFSGGQGDGTGGGSGGGVSEKPDVDDDDEESNESAPIILIDDIFVFEYQKAIETRIVSKRTKPTGGTNKKGEEGSDGPSEVNPGEQGPGGNKPSAEWKNADDQTDDSHLYLSKFESYLEMLERLKDTHKCDVSVYPLRKLPAIGKCQKHRIEGNPRCLSVAKVAKNGKSYLFLEVDTSDMTRLSTMVIFVSDLKNQEDFIKKLERKLLRASLSWPKKYLETIIGSENYLRLSHPQTKIEGGALSRDDIKKWADRVFEKLF